MTWKGVGDAYGTVSPNQALNLEYELQLGDGSEFNPYPAQRILYPHYFGVGSPLLALGASGTVPNIRLEVQGGFTMYPTGDADFCDMVEDVLNGAAVQAGFGLDQGRTDIQHGLNCADYPGTIQKKFFYDPAGLGGVPLLYDLPNTAGDFLLVLAANSTGISDTAANSWASVGTGAWLATALAARRNSVTLTGTGIVTVQMFEIAGVNTYAGAASGTNGVSLTLSSQARRPAFLIAWTRYSYPAQIANLDVPRWTSCIVPPAKGIGGGAFTPVLYGLQITERAAHQYRLNETSGTTAADAAGAGSGYGESDGTYTGGFSLNQTPITQDNAGCVLLDGSSGYVDLGFVNPPSDGSNGAFTIEWAFQPVRQRDQRTGLVVQ